MELIIGFIVAVLSIFAAALSRQLTDEFKAWTPWIIRQLVNCAVRRLGEEQRTRFEEEWLAHVNEIPGELGKIIAALGFVYAARRISTRIGAASRILAGIAGCSLLFWLAPLIVVISILIKMEGSGPVLIKQKQKSDGRGQVFYRYKFRTTDVFGRRTRVGRVLVRTDFDQLPNLINVVGGDKPGFSVIGEIRTILRITFYGVNSGDPDPRMSPRRPPVMMSVANAI